MFKNVSSVGNGIFGAPTHNHTKMRKNMSLEIIGAPTHNHTKMRKNLSLKYMI